MIFANYTAFRVALLQLIEGDDIGNTFSMGTADLIIGLGENRVYRDLRASTMLVPMTLTVASNVAPLPADLIAVKEVYSDPTKPFEIIPLQRLRKFSVQSSGNTIYAAQDGDTMQFWPAQTGTVTGKYYQRPIELKNIPWANATTFARYPELFLYAALAESAPFLGFDSRMPIWESKYGRALIDAKHDENMRVAAGSRMTVRAR